MAEKTIAAICTPLGMGAIAVIRISGDDAVKIADSCFCSAGGKRLCELKGYQALFGKITEENGDMIDEAVALVFKAPHSFTGEDTVELSVHGGTVTARSTLRRALECGAVMADHGEFSKRAFLNGKIDLAQAESIAGMISAKSDEALKMSVSVKQGSVSSKISEITEKLLETAACFAAYADFPDEDIEQLRPENFKALLLKTQDSLQKLLNTFDNGRLINNGIDCAIVGKPNVGKSTLMNMLSGSDRSIVTDIAGTTRDIIENTVNLDGIILNLADTAGIRETDNEVEKAGVERAKKRKESALLVLAVFDSSSLLEEGDKKLLSELSPDNTVVVINKSDLEKKISESDFNGFTAVSVSAKDKKGLAELKEAIEKTVNYKKISQGAAVLITERQRDCAKRALEFTNEALLDFESGITFDAVAVTLDSAINALLELTGKRVTTEVADEVFKRFCIGK